MPYLILDARYEKVREGGVIRSQALLIAIGINWDGPRQILGVELANRESRSTWKDFLIKLRERGMHRVEFVASDDHDGLKKAIRKVLKEAAWQRCYIQFFVSVLDHIPRKGATCGRVNDECLQELRWLYDRLNIDEARAYLAACLTRWQDKDPKMTDWAENHIEETWTSYRLPRKHHKHLKSTNMLERLNEEIRRRTRVVRIFPNHDSCWRLIRALVVETHEDWLEANRYLNMDYLKELKKEELRNAA